MKLRNILRSQCQFATFTALRECVQRCAQSFRFINYRHLQTLVGFHLFCSASAGGGVDGNLTSYECQLLFFVLFAEE